MTKNEIIRDLKIFLEDEFPNQAVELTESTNLLEEWFVDSLGIIEMVMFLESRFGVEVSRAEINGVNFENLKSLSGYILSRT